MARQDYRRTVDEDPIPARLPKRCGSGVAESLMEASMARFDRGDRRSVAVMITADGRRVHVPIEPSNMADVSLLDLLRSLPGLGGLLELITGSRRDRGSRRGERH